MRLNKTSLYYILPFLIFLLICIVWQKSSTPTGRSLPTFNLPILYHSEKRLTNEDLLGKVALVNFWASWCSACINEHSILMWIKENYHIPIFGIDFEDYPESAKNMIKKFGNPYIVVAFDENGITRESFSVQMIPQTFLIDPHGKILYRHIGTLNKDEWENKMLPLIEGSNRLR